MVDVANGASFTQNRNRDGRRPTASEGNSSLSCTAPRTPYAFSLSHWSVRDDKNQRNAFDGEERERPSDRQ